MKKKSKILPFVEPSYEENVILTLLTKYGKFLLYFTVAFLIAILAFLRISSANTFSKEKDYIEAEKFFNQFHDWVIERSKISESDLDALTQILVRRPELQSQYDGLIAQDLLMQNRPDLASPYSERAVELINSLSLFPFKIFSQISLAIENKAYEEALAESQKLNQLLLASESFENLKIYNLMRIAFLTEQLGQQDTLQEVKKDLEEMVQSGDPFWQRF